MTHDEQLMFSETETKKGPVGGDLMYPVRASSRVTPLPLFLQYAVTVLSSLHPKNNNSAPTHLSQQPTHPFYICIVIYITFLSVTAMVNNVIFNGVEHKQTVDNFC